MEFTATDCLLLRLYNWVEKSENYEKFNENIWVSSREAEALAPPNSAVPPLSVKAAYSRHLRKLDSSCLKNLKWSFQENCLTANLNLPFSHYSWPIIILKPKVLSTKYDLEGSSMSNIARFSQCTLTKTWGIFIIIDSKFLESSRRNAILAEANLLTDPNFMDSWEILNLLVN